MTTKITPRMVKAAVKHIAGLTREEQLDTFNRFIGLFGRFEGRAEIQVAILNGKREYMPASIKAH